jgi:hypothetical protein
VWNEPAGGPTLLATLGIDLTANRLLYSVTGSTSNTMDGRIARAITGGCSQDQTVATSEPGGLWSDPSFDVADPFFATTIGGVAIGNIGLSGNFSSDGTEINAGTLTADAELGALGSQLCGLFLTCYPCSLGLNCVGIDVSNLTWDATGPGPLLYVP